MTTIYIKGINKYKSKLRKALYKSSLIEGDHYIEGNSGNNDYILYWITSRITIKEFKKAIGANIIWKYRLRFYKTPDEINKKTCSTEFSEEEKNLILKYEKISKIT